MKEIARFKNFVVSSNTGLSITKEYWDEEGEVLLYTAGQKPIKTNYLDFPKELLTTKNDILVARNGAGAIQLPELNSIYTDHVIRFILKPVINRIYAYFALWNCVERIASEANDVSLKTLSKSVWIDQAFYVPSIDEQTAIAEFLLNKCENIDTIIAMEETIISELNEYKKSIIQKAVTKGITDIPLKDSNIEWVGQIPVDWKITRVKYIADVVLGKMLCNEDKGDYYKKPYLKSKNIQWLKVDVSSVDEMWFSADELVLYRLKKGDLILSEGGEVGKTCIWNNELDECYIQNSAHKVTINKDNNNRYFLYLFNAYSEGFNSIVHKISIAHLTKEKLMNVSVIIPPLSEQNAIAEYLDKKTSQVDALISLKQRKIAELKEYKKSLIYEYVTGKKEPPKGVYE
jgi:type I restriction enzyme, S subunit